MFSGKSSTVAPKESHGATGDILLQAFSIPEDDGDDADDEKSRKGSPSAADGDEGSLPGTPEHYLAFRKPQKAARVCVAGGMETWSCSRRRRRWLGNLESAWERRRSLTGVRGGCGEGGECLVVVRPTGGSGRRICMDMEEVRACHDLGLEIPRDFTVEIPGGLSGNSSGSDSPISGPGEDSKEIKAKIRMWAHTVAFVSAATRSTYK